MVRENEVREATVTIEPRPLPTRAGIYWAYPYALDLPADGPAAGSHRGPSLPDRGFRILDTGAKGA
jgi:hypothetical protein